MEDKIVIKCRKCEGNFVFSSKEKKAKMECSVCHYQWLPVEKNHFRIEDCIIEKSENFYKFDIRFDGGHSVCTHIKETSHAYQVLMAIKLMLKEWNNGDSIIESLDENNNNETSECGYPRNCDTETDKSEEFSKNIGILRGLEMAMVRINEFKDTLIKNNPMAGQITPSRDHALMGLDTVMKYLVDDVKHFELETRNVLVEKFNEDK